MLPNSSFPIIFDSINGVAQQNNHSFHNTNEVEAVIRYVNQILKYKVSPSDIGMYYRLLYTLIQKHMQIHIFLSFV